MQLEHVQHINSSEKTLTTEFKLLHMQKSSFDRTLNLDQKLISHSTFKVVWKIVLQLDIKTVIDFSLTSKCRQRILKRS